MRNILIVDSNFHALYREENFLFGGKDIQLKAWADSFMRKGLKVFAVSNDDSIVSDPIHLLKGNVIQIYCKALLNQIDLIIYREYSSKLLLVPFFRFFGKRVVFMVSSDAFFLHDKSEFLARRPLPYWKKLLYDISLQFVSEFTLQTNDQVQFFHDSMYRTKRFIHLPNLMPSINLGDSGQSFDFVWVGNVRDVKRPRLFTELARRLPECSFVMCGRIIDYKLFEELNEVKNELKNFDLIIDLPRGEILDIMSKAFALVNTSTIEGFPNTFLESWSLLTPVISFVDPDSLIAKNQLGEVCDSIEDMVTAADYLVNSKDARLFFNDKMAAFISNRTQNQESVILKMLGK
jgi:glycosyltransferase involved in cell wall biosynthesis